MINIGSINEYSIGESGTGLSESTTTTTIPPVGMDVVTLTSVLGSGNYLSVLPTLAIGDQVRYETALQIQGGGASGETVTVNLNGTYTITPEPSAGDYEFEVRQWDESAIPPAWGTATNQQFSIFGNDVTQYYTMLLSNGGL